MRLHIYLHVGNDAEILFTHRPQLGFTALVAEDATVTAFGARLRTRSSRDWDAQSPSAATASQDIVSICIT